MFLLLVSFVGFLLFVSSKNIFSGRPKRVFYFFWKVSIQPLLTSSPFLGVQIVKSFARAGHFDNKSFAFWIVSGFKRDWDCLWEQVFQSIPRSFTLSLSATKRCLFIKGSFWQTSLFFFLQWVHFKMIALPTLRRGCAPRLKRVGSVHFLSIVSVVMS